MHLFKNSFAQGFTVMNTLARNSWPDHILDLEFPCNPFFYPAVACCRFQLIEIQFGIFPQPEVCTRLFCTAGQSSPPRPFTTLFRIYIYFLQSMVAYRTRRNDPN